MFKDTKRRVVQQVLEGVGRADITHDADFDNYLSKYHAMMKEENECKSPSYSLEAPTYLGMFPYCCWIGAAEFSALLSAQKTYIMNSMILSNILDRIHDTYDKPDYWPGPENHLILIDAAQKYKDNMHRINSVLNSSCTVVALEKGLQPLKDSAGALSHEIDTMVKDRNNLLIDYDAYRHKVKVLQEKHDHLEVWFTAIQLSKWL